MRELAGFLFMLLLLTLVVFYIRWAGNDAYRRGKSPYVIAFAVVFFFPMGLLAWLIFRPPLIRGRPRPISETAPVHRAQGPSRFRR
jgi:type IV secretory pathway TrbL component